MAQSQNRRNTWDGQNGRTSDVRATELLHLYIYDYCKKQKYHGAARAFSSEASVATDQTPPIDVSTGFLADWWGVFWDVYYAKSKDAQASKEATIHDEYHDFLRAKREEVLQQQRSFNAHNQGQAAQAAAVQQQQQQQAQQRRASEAIQRSAQSPHLPQQDQLPQQQQQSVPSQQAQQQQQQQQQHGRASPASSIASLPNNNNGGNMPPPPPSNNNNNNVNTPQSMPANLPPHAAAAAAAAAGRHATASPSFSPQQMQRGVEVVPGASPHPNANNDMMTSPMVNQQQQQAMLQQQQAAVYRQQQQQNAIVAAAMSTLGLQGRDQQSLTNEEKAQLQMQIRKFHMNQQQQMMRNNPNMNNPQAQARLQMQQQAMLQQQQQQAMLQQQQQQQQQQQAQQQHMQQQQQGTPQQPQAQLPQGHPMGSPQVDPAQRGNMMGPNVNGQPRPPHMVGPGGPMPMNANMQNMNGGSPFNGGGGGDMNLMLAQQMMNKGQMPAGLTPQQQQQHQQQMLAAQQQRMMMTQRRMMQQQQAQQAQQAQMQQQQQQQQQVQQQTPQPPPQQLPQQQQQQPGPPQSPPNMNSPNPGNNNPIGSPEGGDKKKNIAVALYQRRQVSHALQQQHQAQQQVQQQQQQFTPHTPQKRQRTSDDASPQLQHKPSPHIMNNNANNNNNSQESPVMAMQQRLQQQSRFDQPLSKSPQQMNRNVVPQQIVQQQQQQRMWTPNDSTMAVAGSPSAMDVQSPAVANNSNANNSNVLSFDLERFMMGDSGDFGEMFASGDENTEQGLMMSNSNNDPQNNGGGNNEMDPFGGGFLASMGGGLDLDNMHPNLLQQQQQMQMMMSSSLQPFADLSGHTNKVSTVCFSMDGQWLASAGHDRKVLIWNVMDKKMNYTLDGHTGNITCARWSPDNRNLVATSSYDKTLRIWDVGTAQKHAKNDEVKQEDGEDDLMMPKQLVKLDCRAQVTAVDFAPDRPDTICSLDAEGELKVWNLNTSTCEKSLKMTQSKSGFSPNPMRFHPRTASILACAVGNQIYIIDITSVKTSGNDNMGMRTIVTDHGKNIYSFDWSADGNFLVAASEDKICVYDATHWKCVMNNTPQSKISGCAFVNGGEKLRILYGGYQDIFLWQCGIPGAQPKKAGSQSGNVVSIACHSVNGQTIVATASHHQKEKNLMLWSI